MESTSTASHPEHLYVPARAWKGIELRGTTAYCTRCGTKARAMTHSETLTEKGGTFREVVIHYTFCLTCDKDEILRIGRENRRRRARRGG